MIQVVAEFGQSCAGSLDTAMTQAAVARDAGCTYVKLQTFQPERLCSPLAPRYWQETLGGQATQFDTFKANGMLKASDWKILADYCHDIGIGFMSSPFDLEAVDLLVDAGVDAIKIASGEITHRQLLELVAQTGLPVVLSTGASSQIEIERAIGWLGHDRRITLLACTLSYPCADEDAELCRIEALRWDFPCHVAGYSDHTTRTDTALAAVVAGADMLEKHCTLDAQGDVPDDKMALEPGRLRQYVAYAQLGEKMRGTGSLDASEAELAARAGARRSLHAAYNIAAGEVFRPDAFVCLRPVGPFAPDDDRLLFGRVAARAIVAGQQIRHEDVA